MAARSSACRRRAPRPKAARVARSLRMYNTLVERCFVDCVDSFRRKDLESAEEKVGAGPLKPPRLPSGQRSHGVKSKEQSSKD